MTSDSIIRYSSGDILAKYDPDGKVNHFLDLLLEQNQKINLVSRETSRDDLLRISADCLIPFEYIEEPSGQFIDIGSGGGFPSLVILSAFPSLNATLIERTGKKERFLKETINSLNLNAETHSVNFVEYIPQNGVVKYDFATMKLVRPDLKMFSLLFRLLKKSGRFIYYAPLDNLKFVTDSSIQPVEYQYYLDDSEQLRKITIFSKKS